ncbi:MAG TPA: hypothetical protein VK927_03670, partial [Adhaeribacter sp.]|nr:hypothetical protein [Adhaeribacter sp.]
MRNAFLLFFFLFWSQAVMGQTVLSSCTAPDSIISKYQDDADRLAVRKIYRNSLAFMDSVDIPK